METIHIIKFGGRILDDTGLLQNVLTKIASSKEKFILVHGGGSLCDKVLTKLGIEIKMLNGRRITDEETLNTCTMVYAGLLNKKLVQQLQQLKINAIGICGVDAACLRSKKRVSTPDFGFVGDVVTNQINTEFISLLLNQNIFPVFSSITYDEQFGLLNTNADSVASSIALALKNKYKTVLHFLIDKEGLLNQNGDEKTLIPKVNFTLYSQLKSEGIIQGGMIPKMENALSCLKEGVKEITLSHPKHFTLNKNLFYGTVIEN